MKAITISAFLILFLFQLQNKVIAQTLTKDQKKTEIRTTEQSAIEQLLFSYRDALNASDVSKVLPLYTRDGVFIPTSAPTAKGREQLKGSYEFVFKTIQIHIEFLVEEIVVSGDYAYAVTNSKGTALIHANG
ncbi:MAG TPA: SgcJ/EcaC family oxidoreductase, partial [Chitinophagaceae bacterium]|nr:SgcJ/EcaC family oxidoreductase [Chitinophagaceae bacterium]